MIKRSTDLCSLIAIGQLRRDKSSKGTGAGGENRTHDLPLTKGLRYHYATPAAVRRDAIAYGLSEGKSVKARSDARKQRLAAALRENLKRRKFGRRAPEQPSGAAADAPGIAGHAGRLAERHHRAKNRP